MENGLIQNPSLKISKEKTKPGEKTAYVIGDHGSF